MKQKKFFSVVAATLMVAAGFTSCNMVDNPATGGGDVPVIIPPVADNFDEGSLLLNGSAEGSAADNFWCHEWRTSDEQTDAASNIIADPADPTNRVFAVVVRSQDEAQAAGNMIADGGNIAAWDSQFFVTFGEDQALKAGDKVRLTMRIKADADQTVGTQSHAAPGAYQFWYSVGDVNFTTEWTDYDSGLVEAVEGGAWGKAFAGMYTIAFNLSNGQHNTFYFDDIRVEVVRAEPAPEPEPLPNPQGEPTYVKDYSTETEYPYYRMGEPEGSSFNVIDGALVIANTQEQANNWDLQPFVIDWLNLKEGYNYTVRLTMASTTDGNANLNFGTWSGAMNQSFDFTASDEFKQYEIQFPASTVASENSDVHLLFQMGKVIGTVKIQKVEVFESAPKNKVLIWEGEFTATAWDAAPLRFSDNEGTNFPYLSDDVYFGHKTLIVEVKNASEGCTGRVMNGWWSSTYADDVPLTSNMKWEIQITDQIARECARGNDGEARDLNLLITNGEATFTSVYYEE